MNENTATAHSHVRKHLGDSVPLWGLLWQDLQEAAVLVQPHVVLPANRHSLNGEGFSEE